MVFPRRWPLILLMLIMGGSRLFAVSAKEQTAYYAAVSAFRDGMWGRAETGFAQFVKKYPKSTNAPMALLLEAQAEYQQGDFSNAIARLTEPENLKKARALADQYVYWTAEAQFAGSNYAAAADAFISLSQKYPDSPLRLRAVVEAAAAYAQLGEWRRHDALLEATNGVFQQTARLDPGNPLVLEGELSMENSKCRQRDFPGVQAAYDWLTNQWLTLRQTQQCQAIHLLYQAEIERQNFAGALAAATNLVQVASSPTNQDWLATGWTAQGAALEKLGRPQAAILAWQNNLANAPVRQRREAILKTAELEIAQGQFTNAEQSLADFLARFPEAIAADIALLTKGELHLKEYAAQPSATDELAAATNAFDRFLDTFTNSPLAGKAHLDRGWCEWFAGDLTNSLADFETAARSANLAAEDRAVARFKMGDVLFAQTHYAGALENYRAVLDDFTNTPSVTATLGDRALYQSLRACLALDDLPGASTALAQILKRYPANGLAASGTLLYGEGLAAATNNLAARAVFQRFLAQFPGSPLRPEVAFDIALTHELEQDWPAAIAGYQGWLEEFPTNRLRPEVDYALARANAGAGNVTNAFTLFTNFVAQFTNNDLAPRAQWWVAGHFFNAADYVDAEKNYELIFQHYPTNSLAGPAQMMAGRAAVARQDYNGAINNYFQSLETDTNCPMELRLQAAIAQGNALMLMDSADTNNPLANFSAATNVFNQVCQLDPTNEYQCGVRAWIGLGKCLLQLAHYRAATNAFAQVLATNMPADAAWRSQAQVALGDALEKMAAQASGAAQNELLNQALNNYLDVFYQLNLRHGERPDPFWRREAGFRAAPLVGSLNSVAAERKFYGTLKTALPQLSDLIDKKLAALPPGKN